MMKKLGWILGLALVLCGCGAAETYETIADEQVQPVMAEPRQVYVALPEDSVLPVMESEQGKIYICGDYDVAVLTLSGGDLDATVRAVSGFGRDEVTLIQTETGEVDKYEFVWTMASEMGQQVGRATILDDGSYHYVLSATVSAEKIQEYQEIFNGMFESYELVSY